MGASDLRVSVAMSRLRCVVEPALVLAHPLGARLALGLARAFEVWLTRSLWRAIDNSELLPRAPSGAPGAALCLPDARAVADWAALRNATDAGSWPMRWVGDCVAESQLRHAAEADLVDRFEWLCASLAPSAPCAGDTPAWWQALDLRAGGGDALALSAALDGAMILCLLPRENEPPWPVQTLQGRGLPACRPPEGDADNLLSTERLLVRQALAGAGLAPLAQALPALAVTHVLLEAGMAADGADGADPWAGAQCWWYRL